MNKAAGVTMEMVACDKTEMEKLDKKLNDIYGRLMSSASETQKAVLRDSQRTWLAYRKINCNLIYTFGYGGTLDTVNAGSCEVGTLAERVRFLRNLLRPG